MVNKGLILCLIGVISGLMSQAQERGVVLESKDSLITLLQEFRAEHEINPTVARAISLGTVKKVVDKTKATRVKRKGFRVQIYSGPNRNEAYATQTRFRNQNKDMDSYITYDEPNYRVKVGDFTSRSEANAYMRTVRSQYKNVFVFQEDIWVWE